MEFGVDEADTYGISSVTFANDDQAYSSPVYGYLENFASAPLDASGVNNVVPSGSYDRAKGAWQTDTAGRVLRIFGTDGTKVKISLDGTDDEMNYADPAYDITEGERTALNGIYTTFPVQLWRVPLSHFTPFDWNWSAGPPDGAAGPPNDPPVADTPRQDACTMPGSVIECENQVLGEALPVVGTPFTLNYRSETQNGYHPTITIPIVGTGQNDPPSSLDHVEVEIQVAGQRAVLEFYSVVKGQRVSWAWDRKDAYGRTVETPETAYVRVSYVYKAVKVTAARPGGGCRRLGRSSRGRPHRGRARWACHPACP